MRRATSQPASTVLTEWDDQHERNPPRAHDEDADNWVRRRSLAVGGQRQRVGCLAGDLDLSRKRLRTEIPLVRTAPVVIPYGVMGRFDPLQFALFFLWVVLGRPYMYLAFTGD